MSPVRDFISHLLFDANDRYIPCNGHEQHATSLLSHNLRTYQIVETKSSHHHSNELFLLTTTCDNNMSRIAFYPSAETLQNHNLRLQQVGYDTKDVK